MVDADQGDRSRAGIARGRAFGISAIAQACLLSLILIVPLFATSHAISVRNAVPIAPYGGMRPRGDQPRPHDNEHHPIATHSVPMSATLFRPPSNKPDRNDAREDRGDGDPNVPPIIGLPPGDPNGASDRIGLIPGLSSEGPRPPQPDSDKKPVVGPVAVSEMSELAQLVRRVEPVYPVIAIHSHVEGTVQMRAIIGRDGSVQELRVVSGNAILAYAAQEAVKQWRFRPTMLNGQPVEVDTFFTVVFKINH
jgi:protein TonB